MLKKLIVLVFACAMSLFGYGDVLLWTVDGHDNVDSNSDVFTLLSPVPEDDLHNPAARVKISGGGLSSPIYLDNYYEDPPGTGIKYLDEGGGYFGVYVSEVGGRYGVHLNQSEVPSELAMEALFVIELGQMTWDDDTYTSGAFEVLAESDPYTYEQIIIGKYVTPRHDLNPPGGDWVPGHYHTVVPSVPEPSELMLCIIGLGLLLLKRKANGES